MASSTPAAQDLVLSREQECALGAMLQGRDVECMGLAGTGKTTLLRLAVDRLRLAYAGRPGAVIVSASSWEAAANLEIEGASSFHGAMGLTPRDTSVREMLANKRPKLEARFRHEAARVIVIDEASMLDEATFDLAMELNAELRRLATARDGKERPPPVVLAFGDLCQLPVVDADHRQRGGARKQSFVLGARWAARNPIGILLETPMRQAEDPEFLAAMVDLAYAGPRHDGVLALETVRLLQSRIVARVPEADEGRVTFVYTHHADVDRHNNARLERLDASTERLYVAKDYTSRYANATEIDKKCRLVSRLRLRVGAVVRLTATLSPALYNGRRGVVVDATKDAVYVRFGDKPAENRVEVGRTQCKETIPGQGAVRWSRDQVPLALSWARTAHGVQGMTGPVAAYITRAFEAEHPYVVFTRARTRADLFIVGALPPFRAISRDVLDHYTALRDGRGEWMREEGGAKRVRIESP